MRNFIGLLGAGMFGWLASGTIPFWAVVVLAPVIFLLTRRIATLTLGASLYSQLSDEHKQVMAQIEPSTEYANANALPAAPSSPRIDGPTVNTLASAARAAQKAQEFMSVTLTQVPNELVSSSDEAALAASSFFAGLAIEFGQQADIPDDHIPVVVEAALTKRLGNVIAKHYADHLQNYMANPQSRLGITAGRAAASLDADDKDMAAALLKSLLEKANSKVTADVA